MLAAVASLSSVAHAASYTQFSCQRPDGSMAPTDGWSAVTSLGGYTMDCSGTHNVLIAALPAGTNPAGAMAAWTWSGRGDVTLRGFTVRREVQGSESVGAGTTVYRLNSPTIAYAGPDVREQCHSRFGCRGIPLSDITVAGLNGGAIFVMLDCAIAACQDADGTGPIVVDVYSATLTLGDDILPRFSDVAGSLTSARPIWGVAELTYRASDVGGGVYRHRLIIDGKPVVEEIADANEGRCRDALPGAGSDYEFDYTVPCRGSTAGRIVFDLNAESVGRHDIEASIEDAAGNRRSIYSGSIYVLSDPARRSFDARGVIGMANPLGDRPGLLINGDRGGRDAVLAAYVRRLRHGRQHGFPRRSTNTYPRTATVVGRLTRGGEPVSGATISVLEREAGSGTWRVSGTLTTSLEGRVSIHLGPGPSRDVRFAYVADSESSTFISSLPLQTRVRPRVALRVRPGSVHNGQRVRFSGRILGGRIPSQGLALSLQASALGGRWLTFRVIRSTPDGNFHGAYRFTSTRGTVRYRFRVRVLQQSGYPFAPAYSRPAGVVVRG
jgi:hypothetical protein